MDQIGIVALVAAVLAMGGAQNAGAVTGEGARLNDAQTSIDAHSSIRSNEDHAKKLGEHFKVPEATITTLSAQKQGWGAINIELSLAWEANRLHSQANPTVTGALAEVERQRAGGANWTAIAKALDVQLKPVIKEARETAKTLSAADAAAHKKHVEAVKVAVTQKLVKEDNKILTAEQDKKK